MTRQASPSTSPKRALQAFAADLERLFGELEQMEPEITVIAGRGGEASAASVSLDETRVNRLILQVRGRCLCPHPFQPRCIKCVSSRGFFLPRCSASPVGRVVQGWCSGSSSLSAMQQSAHCCVTD